MSAPSGDVYAVHQHLVQLQTTLTQTGQTLNGTIAQLMSRIEAIMPEWQGIGAASYSSYMTGYQQDQRQMNAALDRLSTLVRQADTQYQNTDSAVGAGFKH